MKQLTAENIQLQNKSKALEEALAVAGSNQSPKMTALQER
jgi:hypothetical protein